jgi:hypothetical protein
LSALSGTDAAAAESSSSNHHRTVSDRAVPGPQGINSHNCACEIIGGKVRK